MATTLSATEDVFSELGLLSHLQPNLQRYRSQGQGIRVEFRADNVMIGIEKVPTETAVTLRVADDVAEPILVYDMSRTGPRVKTFFASESDATHVFGILMMG